MKYTAWVSNEQGATEDITYEGNTNYRAITDYVRRNYAAGWTLHIEDEGVEITRVILR